ncbi:excinuclease ABC subunit UvrA [Bacillus horti]|uniref:UvrABC system protein A n=1 Tax=Caldalkalibacillus horti TaxID=77523 RepID=A0ABT9W3V4_9BACI|nr:excinuclease ABC subunit UvrA [Bacillus horti]MDQ0167932.1 excinuclease ABC subunit A [Bacillus horti]
MSGEKLQSLKAKESIMIKGARENNLKNISLEIPKHKLVVITGPSGSGKSTLAMDTLQRECQRQYMESMGMVTDSLNKPKVDSIAGLAPSISVGQHVTNRNPRSTVGTVTDIYTYMRVIFAKLGERSCPSCGTKVKPPVQGEEGSEPLALQEDEEEGYYQQEYVSCPNCKHRLPALRMTHFSFNKPEGACSTCSGLGTVASLNMGLVFEGDKSIREGAVTLWGGMYKEYNLSILDAAAKHYGFTFDGDIPLNQFTEIQRDVLYYGVESDEFIKHFPDVQAPKAVGKGKFEGVVTGIWRRYQEKGGDQGSGEAELFHEQLCPDCQGAKLKKEIREITVLDASITEVSAWSLEQAYEWLKRLKGDLPERELGIVGPILEDLPSRVGRVIDVGLGYLSLDRQAITLSGGEAQRLRLASLLGSGLTGVLYILDEPTAGLHPRDTEGLIKVLMQLRDLGNTVLVIEHDVEVMRRADHVIDIGPGAGSFGGTVVGQGSLDELMEQEQSVTGAFLRSEQQRLGKWNRRKANGQLTIEGARLRNLKNIDVSLPLGCLVSVTGVSGSGKSTLLFELLAKGKDKVPSEGYDHLAGFEQIESLIMVTQAPLTRMQRSNVATYTDVFTALRNLYASLPEAREKKLTSKHFSFNTAGGRCENCQGLGIVTVHMHFLPEIEVRCPVCLGKRFKEEILRVTYQGKTISDILDQTIQESLELLKDQKKVAEQIKLLCEVGLGYLKWGQSVKTLSGGEGQRIKLAKELGKKTTKRTLYLLDEPTTGLHPIDVERLLVLLNKLVDAGHTVMVVEHNLEFIRASDWIVDIGPEGGTAGGTVLASGTPEDVSKVEASYTGRFLREELS